MKLELREREKEWGVLRASDLRLAWPSSALADCGPAAGSWV